MAAFDILCLDFCHSFAMIEDYDYINESDIIAYEHALHDDDDSEVVEKKPDLISSRSDWYPLTVEEAKGKKKKIQRNLRDEFRSSLTYHVLRWPILIGITIWILCLCSWYTLVRFYVAFSEYFFTWVGERKKLRDKLRASRSYQEWVENAINLDKYLTLDKWSINPKFSYYDSKSVKLTLARLQALRTQNHDLELVSVLQGCLKKNFAGIENKQLYLHRYYGTKNLVVDYVNEVVLCVDHVTRSTIVNEDVKKRFFRIALKNYGKSALCLSGGACFSYTHFGLVKGLLDNDLLPSIILGTSGGGLIAALACTRTNEELKELLVPELANKITACEDPWWVWMPRWWKTGARFDPVAWARKANFFTMGSMTFEEAYRRTGRKLNVSTVPSDPHSPVILCNNITSPNCIIWSSLLALAAVPGILPPVVLMVKTHENKVAPFLFGSKWRDGSMRTDIPIAALNTYYNVNFPIVSQVNPHISLFFFAPKGTVGRPVAIPSSKTHKETYEYLRGGFIATALEQLLKLEVTKWLTMIKSLDLLPHFLELDWLNIWLQRFSGAITIWPRIRLRDFWYILSDPTVESFTEMLAKGERSVYPKLLFIKHRLAIERAIERGRKHCKLSTRISTQAATPNILSETDDFTVHLVDYDDEDDSDLDYEPSEDSHWSEDPEEEEAELDADEDDLDDDGERHIPERRHSFFDSLITKRRSTIH